MKWTTFKKLQAALILLLLGTLNLFSQTTIDYQTGHRLRHCHATYLHHRRL